MKHSILAPSKAFRLSKCAASPIMEAAIPDLTEDENKAALEGTAAHYIGELILNSYKRATDQPIVSFNQLPETDPDGEPLTRAMFDSVKVYTNEVLKVCNKYGALQDLRVEQPVEIKRVHDQCFGTPDAAVFIATDKDVNNQLHLWDYKHGYGIVEAEENEQLMSYACGLIDELGLDDLKLTLHLHIVQPNVYHVLGSVRTWTVEAHEIRAHINHLSSQAQIAMSGQGQTVSGSHCLHCSARRSCPAAHSAAMNAIDVVNAGTPLYLDDFSLGVELRHLQRAYESIKARITALESDAMSRIQEGKQVNGFAIGQGRGSVKWKKDVEPQVIAMAQILKVDIAKPQQALTPTQAESEGVDLSLFEDFIERKNGSAKLINEEDTLACRVFKPKR